MSLHEILIRSSSSRNGSGFADANHYAALLLFAQLITGMYLMSQGSYKIGWIIAVAVFFLSMGPLTGFLRKQFGSAVKHFDSGHNAGSELSKIRRLSIIPCLIMIVILILMVYPQYA